MFADICCLTIRNNGIELFSFLLIIFRKPLHIGEDSHRTQRQTEPVQGAVCEGSSATKGASIDMSVDKGGQTYPNSKFANSKRLQIIRSVYIFYSRHNLHNISLTKGIYSCLKKKHANITVLYF